MHVLLQVWRSVNVSHRIHLWGVFGVTSVEPGVEGPAWGTKGKFWGLYNYVPLGCYPKLFVLNQGRQVRGPEPEHDFLLRMWQALWMGAQRGVFPPQSFVGALLCQVHGRSFL